MEIVYCLLVAVIFWFVFFGGGVTFYPVHVRRCGPRGVMVKLIYLKGKNESYAVVVFWFFRAA